MSRILTSLVAVAAGAALIFASGAAEAKAAKKKPKAKKAAKKPAISKEQKQALAELMGAFKFGASTEEVTAVYQKQLDERYAEKIAATSDVYTQDGLRTEKKKELARFKKSFVEFDGKKAGWDVSIIDQEFAHGTSESMMVFWENSGGRNQRRFFFFHDGRLYKMFIALDTRAIADDQRNFAFFQSMMEQRFGAGEVSPAGEKWRTAEFEVRAVDKINFYDAFCLIISDNAAAKAVAELREAHKKAPPTGNAMLKSVTDDGTDTPSLDDNKDALDSIIKKKKGKSE